MREWKEKWTPLLIGIYQQELDAVRQAQPEEIQVLRKINERSKVIVNELMNKQNSAGSSQEYDADFQKIWDEYSRLLDNPMESIYNYGGMSLVVLQSLLGPSMVRNHSLTLRCAQQS